MAFSRILHVLGNARCLSKGKVIHGKMVESGLLSDVYSCNNMISMYVNCQHVNAARQLLETMPVKNVVSWTLVISGYVKQCRSEEALECFRLMVSKGFAPNGFTYVGVLSACADVGERVASNVKEIHGRIYRDGQGFFSSFVGNSLVSFYAKCGMLPAARRVFDGILQQNVVSWASMLSGYCQHGRNEEALQLFSQARCIGVEVNEFVFASVLGACSGLLDRRIGRQMHCLVSKCGFVSDAYVEAGIINFYVECDELDLACQVLFESVYPSLASWTMLIGGYGRSGQAERAINLFLEMQFSGLKPNEHTLSSVIVACSNACSVGEGKQLHSLLIKSGFSFAGHAVNALLDLYVKCGSLEDSTAIFDEMEERNIVSWNTLIAGYVRQTDSEGTAALLRRMIFEGIRPDQYSYSSILSLCGKLPVLQWGKETHSCVVKPGFDTNIVVASALIDMYANCGRLTDAHKVFQKMDTKNIISWNSMIVGYARHGYGKEALDLFSMMQRECVKPNDVTFLGVLSACAHIGLIEEGKQLFDSMIRDHGINPRVDHIACMVDLFARGGQISRAYEFIRATTMEPERIIWRSLLSGCKIHGDLKMGRYAAVRILEIDPEDAPARIMLSGVYSDHAMWSEKAEVRIVDGKNLKKVAGCSWIEVENKIHYFTAGDKLRDSVQTVIHGLVGHSMDVGHAPDLTTAHDCVK